MCNLSVKKFCAFFDWTSTDHCWTSYSSPQSGHSSKTCLHPCYNGNRGGVPCRFLVRKDLAFSTSGTQSRSNSCLVSTLLYVTFMPCSGRRALTRVYSIRTNLETRGLSQRSACPLELKNNDPKTPSHIRQ